ncbi:hypothetical protein ACGK9R_10565 [Halomonas sp. HNIBRBA4712]|uniref:hypothetical protein n=1 Tax=Halomonas sp. HNIBRBA4712 TaxID=3373087 RepID=UPI003744D938
MMLRLFFSLLLLLLSTTPTFALDDERALTAGGHAYAEPYRAIRKEGVLHVEVRFLTDYPGYSGELI